MLNLPKKKHKASAPTVEETVTRVPTQEREEMEFEFNHYTKKTVKLQVVYQAEAEIVDLKRSRRTHR